MSTTPTTAAASIGVIGGADGPTAVLVSAPSGANWLLGGILLLLAAGILFVILRRKKK